jgi:ATP-binding cassette, subfamily B, bacterial
LAAGKRLGVVGPTGSGKTTLSSLILRFFDPTTGRVTLDGVDLQEYKVADLRNQYAVVLQDTVLFSTSVAENIRFARPDASTEEIVAAAKAASAHDFIMNLPNGYNTEVGERGMKLSGGERQRISIARAFLKNAPILLLDEPTSALDVKTETSLLNTIQELMKGRTTFMIAHRPSTLRNCDSIIMLENGRIVKETTEVSAVIESMTMTRVSSS